MAQKGPTPSGDGRETGTQTNNRIYIPGYVCADSWRQKGRSDYFEGHVPKVDRKEGGNKDAL